MEKLYHRGVMRTKCDDCQFVCITQTDYYRIQHQGQEAMQRHVNAEGDLIMVTEQRGVDGGRRGHVVIRVSSSWLYLDFGFLLFFFIYKEYGYFLRKLKNQMITVRDNTSVRDPIFNIYLQLI